MSRSVRREDWQTLKPTVFGWGINDVEYAVQKFEYGVGKKKRVWTCPYYMKWTSLITRCFSNKLQEKWTTYKECTVCEEWRYLSSFINWVDNQPNKDWKNCEPDKDFLSSGNKHYSPEKVVFIPRSLNIFIIGRDKARGKYMIGVSLSSASNKNHYKSRCRNPFTGSGEYLGVFSTELEAHLAWKAKKHEHACALADLQPDPRVAKRLREMYAPDTDWTNK